MEQAFNPYAILGVPQSADEKQIKRAYRKLISKHHPDANGGKESDTARQINKAWAILGDPAKRQAFDSGKPEETIEDPSYYRARDILLAAVGGALLDDDLPSDDLVLQAARVSMSKHLASLEKPLVSARRDQMKIKRRVAKIKIMTGGENLIVGMADAKIRNLQTDIEQLIEQMKDMTLALELLSDYSLVSDLTRLKASQAFIPLQWR